MRRQAISLVAGLGCALALTVGGAERAQAVTIGQADFGGVILSSTDGGALSGLFGGELITGQINMDLDFVTGASTSLNSASDLLTLSFDVGGLYSYDSSLDATPSLAVDFAGQQVSDITLSGFGVGGPGSSVSIVYNASGGLLTMFGFPFSGGSFAATGLINLPTGDAYAVGVGNTIPEPGTLLLLGTGLIGLASARRRARKV